ncbi:MAG: filamentous hemagglutinin family protein [Caulobacteraceae bacterium]|nr:filamentous hemagglutinin family protein [Caulobacteraceae bacterium]
MAVQTKRSSIRRHRGRLLRGVSLIAFVTALGAGTASAQLAALRGAAHVPVNATGAPSIAVPTVPGLSTSGSTDANTAAARALRNAVKAQQAVSIAQQAQAAARQAAAALPGGVPNGLTVGGLEPVANPVLAAKDTTGLNTWQGANAPTQTTAADGTVKVNIQQTAAQAILSWETFNVGAGTSLNFDQSLNGVAEKGWVALNRVVGQIDPTTGLRNPNLAPAPSQILGSITSQGTVLVINQNGILFGAHAQINTNSLIATSLEIGAQLKSIGFSGSVATTLVDRDNIFLADGLLGQSAQASGATTNPSLPPAFSAMATTSSGSVTTIDPTPEGAVTVEEGATITSGVGGYIILAAPTVINSGVLSSSQGQVSLAAGEVLTLLASNGTSTGNNNPNIRGLIIGDSHSPGPANGAGDFVENTATGLIESPEGYASLTTANDGTVINAGTITSSTSVSRNGFIQISAANISLAPSSVISITPDDDGTIPTDSNTLADFKSSRISIGLTDETFGAATFGKLVPGSNIDIGANSLIYAPSANIYIGADPGLPPTISTATTSRIFIDTGAVIDASGLKDVQIPTSAVQVTISPVTANDTANTPSVRGVLNHTTVTIDPRLSGVRSDGVAWVGSPLIPAEAYAEQVGVSASQLMTKGGNVVIGAVSTASGASAVNQASDVLIKPGAVIDVSGGWLTYKAGLVQTTQLVDASGAIINIGQASPDDVYLGVYNGFTAVQPRFGIQTTYANPLLSGAHYEAAYSQGADAGSLTVVSSQPTLQGTIYADAYTGPQQAQAAVVGTKTPTLYGDQRHLQAVGSQLPSGGLLFVQETGSYSNLSGGDVEITNGATPATAADLTYGQSVTVENGVLSVSPAVRSADSLVPMTERETLTLSADGLSQMGLSQFSVYTSGALTIDAGADLTLAPGGVFSAITGRAITVNGDITVPSGLISLATVQSAHGSIFAPSTPVQGDFDVTVNGVLSTAGLWTNDYANTGLIKGAAYIKGGAISISVEPRVDALSGSTGSDIATVAQTLAGTAPLSTTDISGSILIDGPNALLDVSAGGYVAPDGTLNLTAKGGDVTLTDATAYFPFALSSNGFLNPGAIPGFRVNGITNNGQSGSDYLAVNPDAITARVSIADGAIHAFGFSGGGVFTLTTPAIAFADGQAATGTNLSLDFFSKTGFSTYNITSYGTDLIANTFSNGLGGYNAVLATQVLTVQSGQNLNLTQTGYSTHLTGAQIAALRNLGDGGRISDIVAPSIEPDAYDQRAISLNLGGLIELKVAQGGEITGAAGAALSASQIYNQGVIRLAGGTLSQSETLPGSYVSTGGSTVVAASSLSDIFSINPDGSISESAMSVAKPNLTNAQLAATVPIYLTGDLPAGVGVDLAPGSVTDLSGEVLINPYATGVTQGRQVVTGRVVSGGVLQTATANINTSATRLFPVSPFETNQAYALNTATVINPSSLQPGLSLVAEAGSNIDLSGASGVFDQITSSGQYIQSQQWSSGGALTLGAAGTLTGAVINAKGGAASAAGGVLTVQNLILTAVDPTVPAVNTVSAEQIEAAGFGTLVAQGDLRTSGGPVDLSLGQAFYLTGLPTSTVNYTAATAGSTASLFPIVSVSGSLRIDAPYIALDGAFQAINSPAYGANTTKATGDVTFNAQVLDVTGAVLFDRAVANVTLQASGDLRFTGVAPIQSGTTTVTPSLVGQLAVNGNLNLVAGQVYATTGSTFTVTSAAQAGVITILPSGATPPATPYSAGSNLLIQASHIVQDGVLRAPLGTLTLGSNTALTSNGAVFAPATASVELGAGSVTSVSADGLSIPYGTTTDQTEYYFTPTGATALTAPPAAILTLTGQSVTVAGGATVDLKGGGDIYAYEFVPGVGGSRDVLSQYNSDAYTSNGGYQYADHRQVYAIVPGLSNAAVAAYDPVYSSNYSALYSGSDVGKRVYLSGGNGIAAGWYTLLPAQYAMLPGGMEVVEDTSATRAAIGGSSVLTDGVVAMTGQFGGLGGTTESSYHVFDIKSQAVIKAYSDIVLTSGDTAFAAAAASAGGATPRLPTDAGRLVLNPTSVLDLSGAFETTPGKNGRGAEVDITGGSIEIVDQVGAPVSGVIQLSADQLTAMNADSLLIGGVRTDNADGTTSLKVSTGRITVANDASHPLTESDIVLVVDGSGATLTLNDGAAITASGNDTTGQTGDYVIDGATTGMTGQGALVRVSAGPQRLVTLKNQSATAHAGVLTVGAIDLTGTSTLLESSGVFNLSASAKLSAANFGLEASSISFAPSSDGRTGLVITPTLMTSLAGAQAVTLRSSTSIDIASGDYSFSALTLDAPGLTLDGGTGTVSITAKTVKVQDSGADAGACSGGGLLACGSGQFALTAQNLTFGDGTFRIYGAAQGVSLTASNGIYFQGKGALNVGAAPLSIQTPFLGDQMGSSVVGVSKVIPSLTLTSTGAIALTNPTGAAVPSVTGVPGANLTLSGQSISVTGVDVRATAGALTLTSANGLTVGAGAILETPGFSRSFGDAADPYTQSAPGGLLTLTALNGDIDLAAGSTLSVGGGVGAAGDLMLNASHGKVNLDGNLNASAPGGGAGFALNEAGAFDLTAFESGVGAGFNGDVSIATGAGDLILAHSLTLKATNVRLTADGGVVDIAGTIDVSGINGGDVGLFGANGVTLESTASIIARASGYAATDTRQAKGGNVELGTEGTGALTVAAGAVIDVSAARTAARAVETVENGVTNYVYVAADQGGVVTLRAPVSGSDNAETVNVSFAGAVQGASSIVLEGYKPFDLAAIAASGQFTGVTITGGVATLDTTASAAGRANFLADVAPGTLANFIQTFDVSTDYGNLGGLASQANFHARPGVELDYSGGVTLASNWNLGAGTVDVAGAVAAGLMVADPGKPGAYAVIGGDEGAVFSNFTKLTYRVGGDVLGEAGALTIKAGGQLNINGSVTDGFFTFGDQTDPTYLNSVGNTSSASVLTSNTSSNTITVSFPGAGSLNAYPISSAALIPYDAAANTPGALGSGVNGAGDPIGSAEIFPLVQTTSGAQAVGSWSYQFTGGAAANSADPSRVLAGSAGGITVQGTHSYSYGGVKTVNSLSDTLLLQVSGHAVTPDQWLSTQLALNPNQTANSPTLIDFTSAPSGAASVLSAAALSYFAQHPGAYSFTGPAGAPTGVSTTLALASGYLKLVASEWSTIKTSYTPPPSTTLTKATATVETLIRTGSGSIDLAAAGVIDLRNGATAVYRKTDTEAVTTASNNGFQQGGVAIYTAGVLVDPATVTAVDAATGATITFDPSAYATTSDNVSVANYGYGVTTPSGGVLGLIGVLVSNTVYTQGGGDISLNAGGDILGRRDAFTEYRVLKRSDNLGGANFIGTADQPWRVGVVGMDTNIQINPQMFTEGVGTLGGGDISVTAGGKISDLSVVADTTMTTAKASSGAASQTGLGLLSFGGGNVTLNAGGDLLGGRVDVASGVAAITAGGSVVAAGVTQTSDSTTFVDNTLRLRLTDATIDLTAHGDVNLQAISALGVKARSDVSTAAHTSNSDADGFYSANADVSIVADGSVSLTNSYGNRTGSDNSTIVVLPGSLTAVSLEGGLRLNTSANMTALVLSPTASGTLTLAAGANIAPVNIAMLDNDPGLTPGLFSQYESNSLTIAPGSLGVIGMDFAFPAVLPTTSLNQLEALHDPSLPHKDDPIPNRIYAGGDIQNMVLSTPKQTRIGAGRDIINMMFFGQNLNSNDVTRIVAGRDITATTALKASILGYTSNGAQILSAPLPTLQGDSFILGGPGDLWLEAGRNLGPFLNSATVTAFANSSASATQTTYGGGVITVGNAWNPYLESQGASIHAEFGVAKGQDFDALLNYYLNPANTSKLPDYLFTETLDSNNVYVPDKSQPIYAAKLIAYMQAHHAAELRATYGATAVTYDQAYTVFAALPKLEQRPFLLQIYFNELSLTSVPGPTFDQYQRGYLAANLLFPAALGYTANSLTGGTNGANTRVQTGDLDLRLAAIETQYGGNIDVLGPGGRVLAGSTVATAQQAARRNSEIGLLYAGNPNVLGGAINGNGAYAYDTIASIPSGYEGVLTLRGGNISAFTDGDFVLNQSRLFTEQGGDIIMWSSNGDLNAGQGPKTSANFPPVVVKIDNDAYSILDQASAVTGAGIAAFEPAPGEPAPDVFLVAPRGTVDAGAAGVRVAGNLFVAALHVANADNFSVVGAAIGLPPTNTTVEVGAQTTAASSAATQAAQAVLSSAGAPGQDRSIITVEVLGFGDAPCPDPSKPCVR